MAALIVALASTSSVAQASATGKPGLVCERYMARISAQEQVPLPVLYAVGLTETGNKGKLHPFALNIEGKTVFARDKSDALRQFAMARKQGKKLIDLGCMQVNHYYHGSNFASPEEMLVPEKNIVYAARFLKQLRQEHGSWTMAVARYHASAQNKKAQKRYICNVIRNLVASDLGAWTPEAKSFCSTR
ncbi:MAG: transglycosylase SLT domain-containing protein [Proteobacteria bacterium]|nr:transglycosylase SLT domain-containing protein [Pseudomonadota bacterium]